jgi:predicted nucleic acid-binding Zn finger protein
MAVQGSIRSDSPQSSANARAERALELYRHHGRKIVRLAENVYRVPSQDGERSYDVVYGEREECVCPDFEFHGGSFACKHILAVGISVAKRRGATVRALARLEESYRHELMDEEQRQELRDRVLRLRRRLGLKVATVTSAARAPPPSRSPIGEYSRRLYSRLKNQEETK